MKNKNELMKELSDYIKHAYEYSNSLGLGYFYVDTHSMFHLVLKVGLTYEDLREVISKEVPNSKVEIEHEKAEVYYS